MKSGLVCWARTGAGPARKSRTGRTTPSAYLAAHAFVLGGFTAFCQLGSFSRLTLARRVFGRARVDSEIGRIRPVLAGWGYRLGRDDDQLLPMAASQVFLLNRSPHLEALSTGLFEQVRRERLLPAAQGNTLYAMQRAVADLGFCGPPQPPAAVRRPARAAGGAQEWATWADRWHGTSTLTPGSAAPSAPPCSRPGDGWRPSIPRPPTPPPGHGRPARPGSPHWTGCRSATTPSAPPG